MNYSLSCFYHKSYLLIIALFLIFFSQEAIASVSYQEPSAKTVKSKRYNRLKKVLKRKKRNFKKPQKTQLEFGFVSIIIIIVSIGILLFIFGLIFKVMALWIIGLCLFGLPVLAGIVILLILILGLAFGNGMME